MEIISTLQIALGSIFGSLRTPRPKNPFFFTIHDLKLGNPEMARARIPPQSPATHRNPLEDNANYEKAIRACEIFQIRRLGGPRIPENVARGRKMATQSLRGRLRNPPRPPRNPPQPLFLPTCTYIYSPRNGVFATPCNHQQLTATQRNPHKHHRCPPRPLIYPTGT